MSFATRNLFKACGNIRPLLKKTPNNISFIRKFEGAYMDEAVQRTTMTRLTEEEGFRLQITGFNEYAFFINNKITVLGPMAIFPKTIYRWNIEDDDEINEKSLAIFTTLEPRPDILIIGVRDMKFKGKAEVVKWLIKNKITNFEILPTEKAIHVFNFTIADDRYVAAVLIPPEQIIEQDRDTIKEIDAKKLYAADSNPAQKTAFETLKEKRLLEKENAERAQLKENNEKDPKK